MTMTKSTDGTLVGANHSLARKMGWPGWNLCKFGDIFYECGLKDELLPK